MDAAARTAFCAGARCLPRDGVCAAVVWECLASFVLHQLYITGSFAGLREEHMSNGFLPPSASIYLGFENKREAFSCNS